MHVFTHLSDKYENMRTAENGWSIEEAGMAQLDRMDVVPGLLRAEWEMMTGTNVSDVVALEAILARNGA